MSPRLRGSLLTSYSAIILPMLFTRFKTVIAAALAVLFAIAVYFLLPPDCPEQARRAAAIFIIAAIFWACELIPLYATSILVIVLEIFFLAGAREPDYTTYLKPFAHPVIMLFFGGFVIARALQKYRLDEMFAAKLVKPFGRSPYGVLLGFMSVTAFLSMWLSNTATAALMFALIGPVLAVIHPKDPFRKALIFGIAMAATFGGVATPVGTPPNALVIGLLAQKGYVIHFIDWMKLGVPLMILFVLAASVILHRSFIPAEKELHFELQPPSAFTPQAWGVLGIALVTVTLWLTSYWHHTPESIIALCAVAALAGSSLVTATDIRRIEWDMLILIWGGLALSTGIEVSGLAAWLVKLPIFSVHGLLLAAVFLIFTVALSTFMSNTAAVNIVVPLILALPTEARYAMAVLVAIGASLDVPLPMSTPPAAMAYGTGELKISEMLKVGLLITAMTNALLFGAVFVWAQGKL